MMAMMTIIITIMIKIMIRKMVKLSVLSGRKTPPPSCITASQSREPLRGTFPLSIYPMQKRPEAPDDIT